MATNDVKSLLDKQKDAVDVLCKSGKDEYNLFLERSDILDFLSAEEKLYFADLNLEEIIYSTEDDSDDEDCSSYSDPEVCSSLEIDGPSPLVGKKLKTPPTEMVFSPGISKKIIDNIKKSSCSIKIAMFMFTDDIIFWELCQRMRAGTSNGITYVDIQILVDETQFQEFIDMAKKTIKKKFSNQEIGIQVKKITRKGTEKKKRSGKAHEKFMIVDESIAITGSYNFTWASENINHENVVISNDYDAIVSPLIKHYKKLSKGGRFDIL